MKRTPIIAAVVIICLAVFCYPFARLAWERHTREQARLAWLAESKPPVLDTITQGILTGADRVETFRLADFHEDEDTPEARAAKSTPPNQFLDDYAVVHKGPTQGAAFAASIGAALKQTRSPGFYSQCFDPGVGYRVWKGKAHTDLCVCFYCEGIELITKDAHNKEVTKTMISLDAARPAFLTLSRQAFPQDKALAALKTS